MYSTSIEDLRNLIGEFRKIEEIIIPRNINCYPQGYAFLDMYSKEDWQRVIDYADERHLHNRQIRVLKYEKDLPKDQRPIFPSKHSQKPNSEMSAIDAKGS